MISLVTFTAINTFLFKNSLYPRLLQLSIVFTRNPSSFVHQTQLFHKVDDSSKSCEYVSQLIEYHLKIFNTLILRGSLYLIVCLHFTDKIRSSFFKSNNCLFIKFKAENKVRFNLDEKFYDAYQLLKNNCIVSNTTKR